MSQKTFASLFSCAGCVDQLAEKSGYLHSFAVEYDAEMANLFHHNYKNVPLFVQDIVTFDAPDCSIDWLHASPPCVFDSGARLKKVTEQDLKKQKDQMSAVFNIIKKTEAKFVSIENVAKFYTSEAFAYFQFLMILEGYHYHMTEISSKHLRVGQDRKRTFCLYYKDETDIPDLNVEFEPFDNWFEAFDLEKLEEAQYFHIKPIQRLVDHLEETGLIKFAPYIIERTGYKNNAPQFRDRLQNMWTIKSAIADDYKGGKGRSKYLLVVDKNLKGYNVHHDQLKLLQGFSRVFDLGDNSRVAVRAAGNGCPPQMLQRAIKQIRSY